MAQDIRKLVKEHAPETPSLPKGHEARFEERLQNELFNSENDSKTASDGSRFIWLKIAAIAIIVIVTGIFGYIYFSEEDQQSMAEVDDKKVIGTDQISLGDLSPDLKKVEDYYMSGINVQLTSLNITDENKDLIDGYMIQLRELDDEYSKLNTELNKNGPSEATITALIDNLKIRLDLLFKLKNKLKELKNQENDEFNSIQT